MERGKARAVDNVLPNLDPMALKWLATFFSNMQHSGTLPRSRKKAKVIAVLKANKSPEYVAHYRPISLLSCCFKLFE